MTSYSRSSAVTKSEETRSRILAAALELFRRRGFEEATMRDIAVEAGVALGSTYYYFASKEAIVMAFYEQASKTMSEEIEARLATAKGLEDRLRTILDVKFEYFSPNRLFLGALLRHAADPQHPLSPFSNSTAHIRERDIQQFASALADSRMAIPKDFAPFLPNLIWLYQMGLILFWISDRSHDQVRTSQLREKSLSLVVTAVKLSGFPLLRPLRKKIIDLLKTIEAES